ncbi:MAG: MerR family transcriptional regulator [Thermoleophilia bacterium]|nr:MerR family transcriptional regulator [Thermoleophilia bacterium]
MGGAAADDTHVTTEGIPRRMTDTSDKPLRIGQVCDLLRDEFPDISISKLRFLQDKGIVEPARTPGGYRVYTSTDVEALRAALQMQRDEFMPLRVIRDELRRRLQSPDSSSATNATSARRDPEFRPAGTVPVAGRVRLDVEDQYVSADAVVRATSVTHEFLEECRAADIVTGIRDADGGLRYTQDEVGLVNLAGALAQLGLDVRHLRQASSAMARQGAMVEQFAATLLRVPGADQRDRGLRAVEHLTQQLAEFMRIAFVRDVKQSAQRATSSVPAPNSGARDTTAAHLI